MAFQTIPGTGGAPDSYVGTSGVDSVSITNNSNPVTVFAYQSDDVVEVVNSTGVVNAYTIRGGDGNDTFTSTITTIGPSSFLNGNAGNDTLTFTAFNGTSSTGASLRGGQGNDTIRLTGSLDASLLNGNMDDDTITTAGASNSSIFGGQGVDTLNIAGTTVLSVIDGNRENDTIRIGQTAATQLNQTTVYGGDGNDTITIFGNVAAGGITDTSIYGGAGNDTLNAQASPAGVRFYGDDGNDRITGSTGGGSLFGGAGADTIAASGGVTAIAGGTGADTMAAGAGNDTFSFAAGDSFATTGVVGITATFTNGVDVLVDQITGFSAANDKIAYSTVPTNVTATGGLGANATIANGRVLLSPNANELSGNIRVYVPGGANGWNATTGVFSYAAGTATGDYMVFQISLAAPIPAGGSTQTDITNLFNTAEVVIIDGLAA